MTISPFVLISMITIFLITFFHHRKSIIVCYVIKQHNTSGSGGLWISPWVWFSHTHKDKLYEMRYVKCEYIRWYELPRDASDFCVVFTVYLYICQHSQVSPKSNCLELIGLLLNKIQYKCNYSCHKGLLLRTLVNQFAPSLSLMWHWIYVFNSMYIYIKFFIVHSFNVWMS